MKKKVVLMILDGWGHGDKTKSDAIHNAHTPFIDSLYLDKPHAQLRTDGLHVGLPAGQMGNSEVGHLNIGAGRIVNQDLVRINKAIEDGSLAENAVLQRAIAQAKSSGSTLHFMGLVSEGGVHSSQEHLQALCTMATDAGVEHINVHAFTDGRDTDPESGHGYLTDLLHHLESTNAELATVIGRYYAMDRDNRWERVQKAYNLLTQLEGLATNDIPASIQNQYDEGVTDEFLPALVHYKDGKPVGRIQPGDVVVCFNFRTDRCREITIALTQRDFPEYDMQTLDLHYYTMTNYDRTFKNVGVLFDKDNLNMTLGETLSKAGKQQIRIAETEKYPHVTFFFSGGREAEFAGEKRLLVPSPKVATYDLKPEMSAYGIVKSILPELQKAEADFVCLNFANPDMVGHTGVYEAVVEAVEVTDTCAAKVVDGGLKNGYSFIIIADHGNADFIVNEDGSPNTAHTTNPVPIILIDPDHNKINDGILADVAPTILALLDVEQPVEMTGKSLL